MKQTYMNATRDRNILYTNYQEEIVWGDRSKRPSKASQPSVGQFLTSHSGRFLATTRSSEQSGWRIVTLS